MTPLPGGGASTPRRAALGAVVSCVVERCRWCRRPVVARTLAQGGAKWTTFLEADMGPHLCRASTLRPYFDAAECGDAGER